VEYFFKAPDDMADRLALVLHPMLATGNSAVAAVDRLKESGAKVVRIVCLLVTAPAIEKLRAHHPDVHVWTAAIDDGINEQGYILPGLGDVGDRMYGTR
jgi:uracil phosphoribosyltransferase